MKLIFGLFAVIGLVSSAKLNGNFKAPSRAAFAGGSPGAIFAPLPGARAARAPGGPEITVVDEKSEPNTGDGSYSYSYSLSDGRNVQEQGSLKQDVPEGPAVAAQGSFSYTVDGQPIELTYTADENGFVPRGAHLPTPPPIPEEILRSLEENAREEAAGGGAAASSNVYKTAEFNQFNQQRRYR